MRRALSEASISEVTQTSFKMQDCQLSPKNRKKKHFIIENRNKQKKLLKSNQITWGNLTIMPFYKAQPQARLWLFTASTVSFFLTILMPVPHRGMPHLPRGVFMTIPVYQILSLTAPVNRNVKGRTFGRGSHPIVFHHHMHRKSHGYTTAPPVAA